MSAVADLLCLIEMIDYLHKNVQVIIETPKLAMTLLFDVSCWWR